MTKNKKCFFITLIFFVTFNFFQNNIFAEYFSFEEFNFVIDLPEGFEVTDADSSGDAFFFETKVLPVKFAIKFYPESRYSDAKKTIEQTLVQFGAKGEIEKSSWFNRDYYLSNFSFNLQENDGLKNYSGWMSAIQVPVINNSTKNLTNDSSQTEKVNILLLTYCDSQVSRDCDQFMISILDSVFFSTEDFRRPGPVTNFAFLDSSINTLQNQNQNEKNNFEKITLNIQDKKIESFMMAECVERSQFVIDREFAVLTIYANHPNWKEAWQRYYRSIFRESYNAFDKVALDIYKNIFPIAQLNSATSKNPATEEYINLILSWIQSFSYERDKTNSDFTPVTATVFGKGSDCDSRALLMCILMEHIGIKSELFISREYSHAIFGLAINKKGAAINVDGTDFVLGETTAKVDFGLIAQDQRDTEKWIAVDLP